MVIVIITAIMCLGFRMLEVDYCTSVKEGARNEATAMC